MPVRLLSCIWSRCPPRKPQRRLLHGRSALDTLLRVFRPAGGLVDRMQQHGIPYTISKVPVLNQTQVTAEDPRRVGIGAQFRGCRDNPSNQAWIRAGPALERTAPVSSGRPRHEGSIAKAPTPLGVGSSLSGVPDKCRVCPARRTNSGCFVMRSQWWHTTQRAEGTLRNLPLCL